MKVGELVSAIADINAGFDAPGLLCEEKSCHLTGRKEFYVIWSTVNVPTGWWYESALVPYRGSK